MSTTTEAVSPAQPIQRRRRVIGSAREATTELFDATRVASKTINLLLRANYLEVQSEAEEDAIAEGQYSTVEDFRQAIIAV